MFLFSEELSLRQMRGSKSTSVSETESKCNNESIIVSSPPSNIARSPLPIIAEGKEAEFGFTEFGETDYERRDFGDKEMESDVTIKVNLAAIDVQ